MANSLPWSVKGVDPRTRDAAKAAARRAGMTLGAWLDHKIRDESEAPAPASSMPEQLDIAALSERLARLSQAQTDTAARAPAPGPSRTDLDAFINQTATVERLTREASTRTAGALDSIARWIEKTEDRLSSGERGAAERQERATTVIAEAIKAMSERIADIERSNHEAQQGRAAPSPRLAFTRDGLAAAVTDIRTRQRALDNDEPATAHAAGVAPERISALREDLRELGSRLSAEGRRAAPPPRQSETSVIEARIAQLAERLDRFDRRDQFEPLLKPLARIEAEVSRLSQDRPGDGQQRVQHEIAHLAAKIDALAARGSQPANLDPVLRDIAELREVVAGGGQTRRLEDLSEQVASLGFEIGRLRELNADPREMRNLSAAIEDVRSAILSSRPQGLDMAPIASLAGQIDALSHKFDAIAAQRHGDQLDDRIDALQHRIELLAEQGPSTVTRQIEALAGRIESLAASSQLSQMVGGTSAPAELGSIEQMLGRLADKIDEAGAPGAGAESFEALERQISGLASRLDEAAATRSAENGIERTLQDLVVHLRSMREETAAERAALVQAANSSVPGRSIAELSSLMTGLRDTHVSSERQTQDALGAVHLSLEAIMARLSGLESELQSERRSGAQQPPAVAPRIEEPSFRAPAAPAREDAELAVTAADRDRFGLAAALGRGTAAPAASSSAFDLPLEPGSGRPKPESTAPAQDAHSVRQSLIAAARRSARAASDAASELPQANPEPTTKSPRRLKEILERRKRPLLLSLAALILAMGTAHIVTGALRGDAPRTATNETRSIALPQAAQPEAPATSASAPVKEPAAVTEQAPAKDQSSALSPSPLAAPMNLVPGQAVADQTAALPLTLTPPAAPPAEAAAVAPEPVQPATAIGDLPAGFGSAGLRKAALDGDARAVYELATKAADGPAAQRDAKLALRLFERAAVAGLPPAQFRVGNMFEKGIGTQRDLSLARIWYQRAAERGNAKAMHNLAVLHAEGVTGKPDYSAATEWFRRAAELGVRDSQYNLAVLLGRGLGAPTDLAQSFVWFSVAAGQGDEDAARKRDEVAQRLKPDELAAAKASAANWKPKTLDTVANEVTPPAKGWDAGPTAAAAKATKPARS
ncbi:conserved hypothetical protein [Hyphomicrobiales bacterium]|nr:conserved hypothetical protein [Hyphomicrobiales bacterium]CAH1696985.1 conserved hypothetical protein [Hyphomicrobiales bacterium]CAI0344923.1 localization factor PodJL [Hyphomicrobiales bacterium]